MARIMPNFRLQKLDKKWQEKKPPLTSPALDQWGLGTRGQWIRVLDDAIARLGFYTTGKVILVNRKNHHFWRIASR
jgi:hypothetical protein